MIRSDQRHGLRRCSSCGRGVNLNRSGQYRRHFAVEPDGRRHICSASGHEPAVVVPVT